MKTFFRTLLFLVALHTPAWANTYYVSKTGLDAHACSTTDSAGTNRLTITQGAACLSAGDTLAVHAGTYTEGLNDILPSGSAGNPTKLIAVSGETVTVNGFTDLTYVLNIINKSYVTVGGSSGNGLIFDAAGNANSLGISIGDSVYGFGGGGSNNIEFSYNEVKNVHKFTCINSHNDGTGDNHHISILHNTVHACGDVFPSRDTFATHGIYIVFRDGIVCYNEIYNIGNTSRTSSFGIHSYGTAQTHQNNVICGNYIHDMPRAGILLSSGNGQISYNNKIENVESASDGGGGISLSCNACKSYFDLIYNSGSYGYYIDPGSSTTVTIQNSIMRLTTSGPWTLVSGTLVQDHNFCSTGCASASNPNFVNTATHDFHLSAGSPAINAGTCIPAVTNDFDGHSRPVPVAGACDVGPYEYDVPPTGSIAVTTPVASSRQLIPNTVTLNWTVTNISSGNEFVIESTFDDGVTYQPIATAVAWNAGNNYTFTPTWPASTNMKIRVCQDATRVTCGTSPAFTAVSPFLK